MGVSEALGGLLTDNQYFGAGFGLFGVGLAATAVRKGSAIAMMLFRRHGMTTVEVTCRDKSFQWLLPWIIQRGARKTQHLDVDTKFVESDSGKVSTQFGFQPSVGTHLMRYQGTWIKVERTREQRMMDPWETVKLTTLGNKRALFESLLEEARSMAMVEHSGRTPMYTILGTDWRPFGHPRVRRALQSVVLDKNISEELVSDVREFTESASWYRRRGIPYRRGYLLFGPPGCGKTSFIFALAGELEYSICSLSLSDGGMSDDRLQHRLADAPENSIILLEDIDAAFGSREADAQPGAAFQGLNRLTLSGLLNAIDGVTSSEGRILFMTTNYVHKLDPALIRPGRVDYRQEIGYCSKQQLSGMFANFYPDSTPGEAEEFSAAVRGEDVSAAQVQGHFMSFKESGLAAIENASKLCKKPEIRAVNNDRLSVHN